MNPLKIKIPKNIKIIFYDMDHTLINSDCDVTWKQFLAQKKIVGYLDHLIGKYHYMMYRLNRLNVKKFTKFQLKQFKDKTPNEIRKLTKEHFNLIVKPKIYPISYQLIEKYRKKGIKQVLLTATNEEVALPVYKHLKLDHMIATKLEKSNGKFTGKIAPPYCWGKMKIHYIEKYINTLNLSFENVSYWGDSITDLFALKKVAFPVAANPAQSLKTSALKENWPITQFDITTS